MGVDFHTLDRDRQQFLATVQALMADRDMSPIILSIEIDATISALRQLQALSRAR